MKSDKTLLWAGTGIAAVLGIFFLAGDPSHDFFSGAGNRPVPGKVYELTADNLAIARRHSPVLVALYTDKGDPAGARMSRGLGAMAERVKDRAIVAMGNLSSEPNLGKMAGVYELPAWVFYRDGVEVSRATGENADLSVDRLLAEQTAGAK